MVNMVINIIRIVQLITAIQLIMGASCNKNTSRPCKDVVYAFEATCEWTLQREIYHVGDTLTLTSATPKTLTDLINPSLIIDYSNSTGIGGNVFTNEFDTVGHTVVPASSKFEFISLVGIIDPIALAPEKGKSFYYQEQPSAYSIKVGIKLKSKGVFLFAVSDCLSRGLNGKNCTKAGFSMTVTNSDKHIALHQKALGFLPDADGYKRIYCFSVQ